MLLVLFGWLTTTAVAQNPAPPKPAVHTVQTGEGLEIRPDRSLPADAHAAERLLLEFGDTSLYDLTLFFADVLRKNFLIADESALKGKSVRLIGHESMTLDAAWEAYLSALRAHGLTTSDVGDLVTIIPSTDADSRSDGVRAGEPIARGERIVTQLLPVLNGEVSDLVQVVKPLLSKDAEVMAYSPANTLIVTDSASNVRKVADLIAELAVAAPTTELRLLRLQYAEASEVRAVIEALYPSDPKPAAATPARRTNNRGKAPTPTPTPTSAGEQGRNITRIIDDERTNTLLVLADAAGHAAVAEIVAELDVEQAGGTGRLHILRLKYALAEEVRDVLSELQGSTNEAPREPRKAGAERTLQQALDSGARIAADPATNALAILAETEDFDAIAALVRELDVERRQVFVDAVFVDLTNTGGRELSLSAHILGSETNPLTASSQTSSDLSSLSISTDLLSGLAAGVFGQLVDVVTADGSTLSVPTFGIALRAIQTSSNVHVMGNPALLVVDHQEAVLTIGRKIPFPVSSALSSFGTPITTYDRVDVATELTVTPHINDATLVTLDVELVVDEVETSSAESDLGGGPTTSGRSVQTRVMVEDGQTIVLAGVESTKLEIIETKVPVLGDIPVLGALFRGKRRETRDSNLLVFLTPYVIEHPADLLRVRRIKEAQRDVFVSRFQGKQGAEWLASLQTLLAEAYDAEEPGS
ncbi:MAG: type II secretion system secretin GspD [Myxococcota bacterium]